MAKRRRALLCRQVAAPQPSACRSRRPNRQRWLFWVSACLDWALSGPHVAACRSGPFIEKRRLWPAFFFGHRAYFVTWIDVLVWLPEVSLAVALIVCVPLAAFLVFHLYDVEALLPVLTTFPST